MTEIFTLKRIDEVELMRLSQLETKTLREELFAAMKSKPEYAISYWSSGVATTEEPQEHLLVLKKDYARFRLFTEKKEA